MMDANAPDANVPDATDGHRGGGRRISPALDVTLDLLSNRRRRFALYYLRGEDGTVTLDELAERVASWERDADGRDSSPSGDGPADERVRADLYHSQLPRLADAGVVTFDAEEGCVSFDGHDEMPVEEYLDLAAAEENVA